MTHKKQKQLIEMQADAEKLFQMCKKSGKPFFQWNDWITNHIETSIRQYDEYRKNRLSKLAQRGQAKLIERVEEKKLRESML